MATKAYLLGQINLSHLSTHHHTDYIRYPSSKHPTISTHHSTISLGQAVIHGLQVPLSVHLGLHMV